MAKDQTCSSFVAPHTHVLTGTRRQDTPGVPLATLSSGSRRRLASCCRATWWAMPGFNAAGSLAQVFRMRLAVSLQRSLAHAVHTRAGRAMAAASGSRWSASFPAASYSDLMLLTRGY
eukprot:SM000212S06926  [mRNA]  locus=s212:140349:142861:- [translate_table: standard]